MNKKIKWVFIILALVVIIILAVGIVKVLLPNDNISMYGNRQENTVKISDATLNKTTSLIKENSFINSAKTYVGGVLIVNMIVDVKKDTKLLSIETMLDKVLELYSKDEKEDYDFQIFVTCNEDKTEDNVYPIIGYKHKTSLSFKWVNNTNNG